MVSLFPNKRLLNQSMEEEEDPEKKPLPPETLNMIFNSSDFANLLRSNDMDMSRVFESTDSHEQLAKLFASTESTFKSSDFLKSLEDWRESSASRDAPGNEFFKSADFLKSLDSLAKENNRQSAAPAKRTPPNDIFTSKDWMSGYEPAHVDINYDKNLFTAGESADNSQSKSTPAEAPATAVSAAGDQGKWMKIYEEGLKNLQAPSVATASPPTNKSSWNSMYEKILSNPVQGAAPSVVASAPPPPMPPLTAAAPMPMQAPQSSSTTIQPLTAAAAAPMPTHTGVPTAKQAPQGVPTAKQAPQSSSTTIQPSPSKKTAGGKKKRVYKSRKIVPESKMYVEYTDNDVLLGRGGLANAHPGNKRYRKKIEDTKQVYRSSSKDEKTEWADLLVKYVQKNGGRFLEKDKNIGKWYIVPDIVARRKAGQALREDNTPESRAAKREKYKKNRKN